MDPQNVVMKYYTDRKTILIVGVVVFFLLISGSIQGYPDSIIVRADLFLLIVWGFLLTISTKYSYTAISGSTLKFVYLLFYRRTVDIHSITEINDQPTYKAGKSMFRSLYIFYKDKNNNTKWIELRITIFPEKTLGRLIKDLTAINPRIQLNKYANKLRQSVS